MSKLDEAIGFLQLDNDDGLYDCAISILEAAEKVDKHHVADATDRWFKWTPEMAALIKALPGDDYEAEHDATTKDVK